MQGTPGTTVGSVQERINGTNIALAKLRPLIESRNEFSGIQAKLRRLLPSKDIEIGGEFLVNRFVAGKQRLRSIEI
jgi:hypothetical protein